jgi:FAD/FMN-containing dehydrogenase
VTPDGRFVRTDADHEPDLFWAVRGGGGSVGVVTALEMRLYPVRELYAGALFFPIQRAAQVLHAWRAWTSTVPDEVTSWAASCGCRHFPKSLNRCAAGPSHSWRPPAWAMRAPAVSYSARCAGSTQNSTPSR